MTKITGIRSAKTKSDKIGYTYYFSTSFTDYEIENAEIVEGHKTGSGFSYTKFDVKVGDEVNLVYVPGFEGKAVLENIVAVAGKK